MFFLNNNNKLSCFPAIHRLMKTSGFTLKPELFASLKFYHRVSLQQIFLLTMFILENNKIKKNLL